MSSVRFEPRLRRQTSPPPLRSNLDRGKCACGGTPGPSGECAACRAKRLTAERSAARGGGAALDSATRGFFETRFGHDFGHVRVHTGSAAAKSAAALDAAAYTVGSDVVFAAGGYAPQTTVGRRLLAHELVHVVQQSRAAAPLTTREGARHEREADAAAKAVAGGAPVRVVERATPGTIQRAAPAAAAAPAAGLILLKKCALGALTSAALDAAIQYGMHLWRLRRWPWERARDTWERYRHDWCSTVLSAILGCVGGIVAYKWIEPLLKTRFPTLFGAAGGTLLGRLLLWLAVRGVLAPRMAVKWLAKLGCIALFEAEALHPGITAEEGIAEATPVEVSPEPLETAPA